jgi:FG-GAP-like repeat
MKKAFLSVFTVMGLAALILIQNQQSAQAIDPCGNPSGVGYQCYEDSVVNGRTDYGQTQQLSGQVQAGAGYVITRSEFINNAQFGSVGGPNIKKVQSGASVQISEVIDQTSRELEEAYSKASGQYKKVSAMAEFRSKYQREIAARKEFLSRVESNVDVVTWDASVSGRCVRKIFGSCVDSIGGKLEGKVRVYKLYIGTANDARNFNQSMKTDLAVALSLTAKENIDLSQLPPGIDLGYDSLPRAFVDVNGDGKPDYCRFVGDTPNIYIACALRNSSGEWDLSQQYGYISIKGIDQGYAHLARSFKDINGDGLADYCRFVGNIPREAESCNLATPSGFSPNQYHIKPRE